MGNFMSLMQLPKVISLVNEISVKVQQLEIQVKTLLEDKANRERTPKPTKKND